MASKVKALQGWCKAQCDGYRDVEIRNMTSSWKSGLAFCAIIHRYRPDIIDYDSLKKENVFENNKLAFDVAERELNIAALLDAEDMEAMSVPDKLCICTYVSQYHNYFRNKEKLGGPGVKGKVATKRLPDSRPVGTPQIKKPNTADEPENWKAEPKPATPNNGAVRRGSSMGELCSICGGKVYLMERHIEDSKLYHRRCIREQQRSTLTRSPNQSKEMQKYGKTDQKGQKNQSTGNGKENKKPELSQTTQYTAKPSSNLLTKLHSTPKPYSAISVKPNDQSKTTSHFPQSKVTPNTVPEPSISSKSGPYGLSSVNYNKDGSKPDQSRQNGSKQTFHDSKFQSNAFKSTHSSHQSVQPMDSENDSDKKYEVVGAVVSNFPNDHSNFYKPQVAVAQSKPFPSQAHLNSGTKSSTEDAQMKQGLLKTLLGMKPVAKDLPQNTASGGIGISKVTNISNAEKGKDNEAKYVKPGSGCMFEAKEDYLSARSRLKHTTNDESNSQDKPILKHTPENAPPARNVSPAKPILKNIEQESKDETKCTVKPKSMESWGDKFKGFFSVSKETPNKKTNLLSNVQLDSSDTEESMEVDTKDLKVETSPPPSPSERPVPTPRRSILKKTGEKSKGKNVQKAEQKEYKSHNFSSVPKAGQSSRSPESSTVFSSKVDKTNTDTAINGNNFSAFNLNDSIDLININNLEGENTSSVTSSVSLPKVQNTTPKSAWQIELEARQGIRQKEPKSNHAGIAARIEAAQKQKHQLGKDDVKMGGKTPPVDLKKVGDDENSCKPTWQVEAEKRQALRKGQYNDPEKVPRTQPPRPKNPPNKSHLARPTSPPPPPKNISKDVTVTGTSSTQRNLVQDNGNDVFGRTSNIVTNNKGLNRTPAFKISPDNSPRAEQKDKSSSVNPPKTDIESSKEDIPEWQKEAKRRQIVIHDSGFIDPENSKHVMSPYKTDLTDNDNGESTQQTKKKIVPNARFSFSELSYDVDSPGNKSESQYGVFSGSDTPSPPSRPPWLGQGFKNRPLPSPPESVPKRKVNAEPKMDADDIMKALQIIDDDLRVMENKGRILEEQIRKGSDDDMDMDEDELMIKWFELVNQKNEFVRRESELMYKRKQQELENRHEEVEYELRRLMTTPEHKKTASDKVREDTLLQELLETVGQRNSIVDSMEEDRIRYIEEDQEIAEVMALKDFTKSPEITSPPAQKAEEERPGKKKKEKKEKKEKNKIKKKKGRDKAKTESIFYDT